MECISIDCLKKYKVQNKPVNKLKEMLLMINERLSDCIEFISNKIKADTKNMTILNNRVLFTIEKTRIENSVKPVISLVTMFISHQIFDVFFDSLIKHQLNVVA